jgi:hypothetical protein
MHAPEVGINSKSHSLNRRRVNSNATTRSVLPSALYALVDFGVGDKQRGDFAESDSLLGLLVTGLPVDAAANLCFPRGRFK